MKLKVKAVKAYESHKEVYGWGDHHMFYFGLSLEGEEVTAEVSLYVPKVGNSITSIVFVHGAGLPSYVVRDDKTFDSREQLEFFINFVTGKELDAVRLFKQLLIELPSVPSAISLALKGITGDSDESTLEPKAYKGEDPLHLSFGIGTRKGNVEVDFVMQFIDNRCGGMIIATHGNTICVEEFYRDLNDVHDSGAVIDLIFNEELSPAELFQLLRLEIPETAKAIKCVLKEEKEEEEC